MVCEKSEKEEEMSKKKVQVSYDVCVAAILDTKTGLLSVDPEDKVANVEFACDWGECYDGEGNEYKFSDINFYVVAEVKEEEMSKKKLSKSGRALMDSLFPPAKVERKEFSLTKEEIGFLAEALELLIHEDQNSLEYPEDEAERKYAPIYKEGLTIMRKLVKKLTGNESSY